VIPIMGTKILVRGKNVREATDLVGQELGVTVEKERVAVVVPQLDQYDLISLEVG